MSSEQIQENNKLIAEFMGATMVKPLGHTKREVLFKQMMHGLHVHASGALKYHQSYEWLMPVVEKIESLGYIFEIAGNHVDMFDLSCRDNAKSFVADTKIQAVYTAVIQFMKHYNKKI